MPPGLPPGVYKVYVHNGCGGRSGWSDPTNIEIAARPADPTPIISVKDAGAVGDGSHDDTAAIEALLTKLAGLGGGTAYFPPGTYRVVRRLGLPPHVLVRGSARETTSVQWRWDDAPAGRLDSAIRGSYDFAIEDLSLVFPVSRVKHGIISGMPRKSSTVKDWKETVNDSKTDVQVIDVKDAGSIRLTRLRIEWQKDKDVASICDSPLDDCCYGDGYGARGFLLLLGGRNIRVEDSLLRSAETVANVVGADDLLFARNDCLIGERGWAFNLAGGERVIVEDNKFMGTADSRSGVSLWAREPNRNVYIARNRIENITFYDCEGFTTDGAQGRYFGPIASATADTLTLPAGTTWSEPLDPISSTTCYVIAGKGEGQYRHIVAGGCTKDPKLGVSCTAKVDRPWNVVPDATSQIGINHTVDRLLLVGNSVRKAVNIQVFGSGYEVTFANNEMIDSGGLSSRAVQYSGTSSPTVFDTQPQYFTQWLHNRISGGRPLACPKNAQSKFGFLVSVDDANWWKSGPVIRGFVVRGNSGVNVAGITVAAPLGRGGPLLQDLVLEDNALSLSGGIAILGRVAGVVTEGNTFDHIPTPFLVSEYAGVEIHEGLTPARPLP